METTKLGEVITEPLGIPLPPDYIFKGRGNRYAPAQSVWGVQGTVSYIPDHAEYVENVGNFVYYKGWGNQPAPKFPSKTIAPVEAIYSSAIPKRMTINALRFLSSIHKKGRLTRLFGYYNDICNMTLGMFYLRDGFYCPTARGVKSFVSTLLQEFGVEPEVAGKTGEICSTFFEFDNAYRLRIQDLAGETTKEALIKDLPRELNRLLGILSERETLPGGGRQVVERFSSGAKLLKWAWRFPPFRKKLRKAIEMTNLEAMRLDEADMYHALLYGDYNAKGKTEKERLEMYAGYHGSDQAKWPPRILIRNTGNV